MFVLERSWNPQTTEVVHPPNMGDALIKHSCDVKQKLFLIKGQIGINYSGKPDMKIAGEVCAGHDCDL
jgi:hypothetical protein